MRLLGLFAGHAFFSALSWCRCLLDPRRTRPFRSVKRVLTRFPKGSKHVDLTKAAFAELADLDVGILTVQMRKASDPRVW